MQKKNYICNRTNETTNVQEYVILKIYDINYSVLNIFYEKDLSESEASLQCFDCCLKHCCQLLYMIFKSILLKFWKKLQIVSNSVF